MRVALYARVSTEEQARHGLSIEAQIDDLRRWASDNGHEVIGEYLDKGISARISPSKRPELQHLLLDIQTQKIALIAFTKLDRWTRNIKGYYQVQDTLDKNHVAWIAIHEDYETITASGRFKVNIMLSVAENEADRTSERIKSVFDHKVRQGQAITQSLPLGYSIVEKKVVPDDNAPAALAAFEYYSMCGNKSKTRDYLEEAFGIKASVTTITKLLSNRLYVGEYRDNYQYCDPIIPRELFDKVQDDLRTRSTRKTPSGRVYLFSGLIVCKCCGRRFSSTHSSYGVDYYRCANGHGMFHDCPNGTYVRESLLEEFCKRELTEAAAGLEYTPAPKPRQKRNKAAIQKKLDRLNELYIEGSITKSKYNAMREDFLSKLKSRPEPRLKKILGDDFAELYDGLDRNQKKIFWRSVIDKITVDEDGAIEVFFIA